MKYPFSPEILDAMPEELEELFRQLELTLLDEVCSRLKIADALNEVTIQDIRALRSHGIDLEEIKGTIKKEAGISHEKLDQLLNDVIRENQKYYDDMIDLAGVTLPEKLVGAADIEAIRSQTHDTFLNLTASMGFMVDAGRTMLPPAEAYQWALDNAELQIQSGAISYNQAIYHAVKELADSGIRTVAYESGHVDQIDVAVRRAVMTGVSQICAKYTEQAAAYLETDYFEVSAHSGARDVPGPSPWSSHKEWQGKVYSIKDNDKYPNIYTVCGLDMVDGLEGANCRHRRYPFIDGVTERAYTDEELENIDKPPFEYEGKTYTMYQATQQQRKIERTVRKLKRERDAFKASGNEEEAKDISVKIRRLEQKYKDFSEAAGLRMQRERMNIMKSK